MATNRHQPALLGGLFIGILSSLPLISSLNLCCCLWVVVGGLLTTYLKQQQQPEPVETSDAVIGGMLAGLIGAVLMAIGTYALTTLTGPMWQDSLRSALESNPQITPEIRDLLLKLTTGRNLVLVQFIVGVPMYVIFSMLGALLGLAFFRKKTLPPAPPVQV
jgi:hypothetical protein